MQQVFDAHTKGYRQGNIFGGAASMTLWEGMFAAIWRELKERGVSDKGREDFMRAILAAIDRAGEDELKPAERGRVTGYRPDGHGRPHQGTGHDAVRQGELSAPRGPAHLCRESAGC